MDEPLKREINLDTVLERLGPFKAYNLLNFALLLLPIFLSGFSECGYIFEAQQQYYRCEIPECENFSSVEWKSFALPVEGVGFDSCKRYASSPQDNRTECSKEFFNNNNTVVCDKYVYEIENSVVRDFQLECQEWLRTLIGTIHNSGMFVGLLLMGTLSDRFGRKVALGVSCFANFVFGFSRAFAPNYYTYIVLHFLETACGGGLYTSTFVLAVELVGPKQRVLITSLMSMVFVIGLIILGILAWTVQNWKYFVMILYTPAIIIAIYIWFMNESARWLLSKGRRSDAIKILTNAARINGIDEKTLQLDCLSSPVQQTEGKLKKSELLKNFKSPIIWKRLLTCSFLWITCTFVYYGLSINSISLYGNKYINFILVVLVEMPANILVIFVLDKYGRKRTIFVTFITSGVMCLLFAFFSTGGWWSITMYLLGKSSATLTYTSVYIYVSEVFPTNLRQTLISICSTSGRIGSLLAPLTPLLEFYYKSLPLILFGVMCLLSSLLVLFLPETNNTRLPDTIEEAEELSRRKKNRQPQ